MVTGVDVGIGGAVYVYLCLYLDLNLSDTEDILRVL